MNTSDPDGAIIDQSESSPKPEKSVDPSLTLPVGSAQASLADTKEPVAESGSAPSPTRRFEFGKFEHDYIWGNVLLAEQKAALLFAADTAFVGYLITKIPAKWADVSSGEKVVIILTLCFIALSIASVAMVVIPRLSGDLQGIVYFKAVANRITPGAYTQDVLRATDLDVDAEIIQHNYELARICVRKFEFIRRAIWMGLCGFAAGLAWLWMVR